MDLSSSLEEELADLLRDLPPVSALEEREGEHRAALCEEVMKDEVRTLFRLARGTFSADVWLRGGAAPERRHLFDALAEHPRLLVVGSRWSGKSALAVLLAAQAARRDLGFGQLVPFLLQVSRLPGEHLDEGVLHRLSPVIGGGGVRALLAGGRALIVIDGLDEAERPGALKDAIVALAKAFPASRFVVTTRPLTPKIPGADETFLEGFTRVRLAAPEAPAQAPILELDERRAPGLRVQRLGEEVRDLLERWSLESLPRGAALRRFTERGRFLLAVGVAHALHHQRALEITRRDLMSVLRANIAGARWFADTEQLLLEEEGPRGGEEPGDVERLTEQIADEIRERPGVIIEARPGVYGAAHLAVQQYLAALFPLMRPPEDAVTVMTEVLELRGDPWWQEVLVMMAGVGPPYSARLPARELIRALLEESMAADSPTTFLAARCAETAAHLPAPLRAQIDRRLRAVIPPRSNIQVAHLVDDVGDIAAPALLAALDAAGPDERAFMVTALGRMSHPSIIPALVKLVGDEAETTEPVLCWVWKVDAMGVKLPVGFYAFVAFFNLATLHSAADRRFGEVLERASTRTLVAFVDLIVRKIVRDEEMGVEEDERDRDPYRMAARLESVVQAIMRRPPR